LFSSVVLDGEITDMEKEPVNVLVGRFQPFTKGHYKCTELIKNKKNLRTIVFWVNPSIIDAKHPFPAPLLDKLFTSKLKEGSNIIDVIFVTEADIISIGKQIADKYNNQYEVATWTCGDDRNDSYADQVRRYKEKIKEQPGFKAPGLSENLEAIMVPRTDDKISATEVREALLNEDIEAGKATFKEKMPEKLATDEIYNTLREQIVKVVGGDLHPEGEASFNSIKDWVKSITYGLASNKAEQRLNSNLTTLNGLNKNGTMNAKCKNLVKSLSPSIDEIKNLSPEDAREKLIEEIEAFIKSKGLTSEKFSRLDYINSLDRRLLVVESLLRRRSYR
jgi:hypothetical protein